MGWIIFESIFSFLEMLTSCFFATGIFHQNIKGKRTVSAFTLFSIFGAAILILREYVFDWIPDFVPAVLIFTLYSIMICRAKWWAAVSWSLVNYLFIGILSVTTEYLLRMCLYPSANIETSVGSVWFFSCILTRIGQFLLSEIILCVWKRFPVSTVVHRGSWKVITVSSISIIMIWILWGKGSDLNEEVLYSNGLVCLLVLAINLSFLLFDEVLAKEKYVEEELKTQNKLIALQMRNQDEINNMYQSILSLKHDMNNHLHTISGYMQVGEYAKAQEYVGQIVGKIGKIKSFHSGNAVVDALIGSKTVLAEMNEIMVDVDMAVLPDLQMTDGDLTVLIGNLYDNAIDANLKVSDVNKRFIPTDLLVKMADSFNVTTDYILGRSDIKRDLSGQIRMNHEMDRYYDIVLRYQRLSDINRKTFRVMLERLEQAQDEQEKLVTGDLHRKEDDVDGEDSSM